MADADYKLMMGVLQMLQQDTAENRRILLQLTTGQRDLLHMIEAMRDDLVTMVKIEISGSFAHLETRLLEHIERRLEKV